MSQYTINIGALPNDGTGDPLRTAFNEVNLNFNQVFAAGPVLSNVRIANNSISTTNTNGNLVLAPNGIGKVLSATDIVPNVDRVRNLGSTTLKWNNIYTQYVTAESANIASFGNLTVAVANLHITGGSNGDVLQTDGTGNLTWTAQTGGSGNATPAGANTQVQYNNAGTFGGAPGFTFNNVANALAVPMVDTSTVYHLGGVTVENADLTHGATAAVILPANGDGNAIQVNNIYGNIVLQAGDTGNITGSWTFDNAGALNFPVGDTNIKQQRYGMGNLVGYLDGGWTIGEYNGTDYGTEGIRINPGIEGSADIVLPADAANVPVQVNNYSGNVRIQTGEGFNWTFDSDGQINIPANSNSFGTGHIQSANGYPTLLAYGSAEEHGGPELDWMNTDDLGNAFGNSSVLRNTMYINDTGLYIGINENGVANVAAPSWRFTPDGNLVLPGTGTITNQANTSLDPATPTASTMVLTPDANYSSQALVLDPTAPGHIHLRSPAAGNVDLPLANIFLGGELSSFEVGASSGDAPNVFVHSNGNTWTFDGNGTLTLAGDITAKSVGFPFTSSITNITTGNPTVIVDIADNVFGAPVTGKVLIQGVVGTTEANEVWYYQAVEANQFQLFNDADCTIPVDGTAWTAYVNGGTAYASAYDSMAISTGGLQVVAGSNSWYFGMDGNLNIPGDLTIGPATGGGGSIVQPDGPLQVVGAGANAFLVTGWAENLNSPGNIAVVGFNAPYGPGAGPGTVGITTGNNAGTTNVWAFTPTGETVLPILDTQRGDTTGGTLSGYTLRIGDGTNEAVITTPDGITGYDSSQRLVINPGKGRDGTSGEGGDIYLWAGRGGDTGGSGGDIKIRGGQGMGTSGAGGYIRIEAGDGDADAGSPGYIDITGGYGGSGRSGGYVRITGGQGTTSGGEANVTGGYAYSGSGGAVNIVGGGSNDGLSAYGNVNIVAGSSTWTFNNAGDLTVPNNILAQEGNDLKVQVFNPNSSGGVTYLVQNWQVDTGQRTTQFAVAPTEITLTTDYSGGRYKWIFDNLAGLTFPDGTRQTTAYIGPEGPFTVQAGNFNAVAGARYGVDTYAADGPVTATLPATPAVGDAVFFADAGNYANNGALTIDAGTNTIMDGSSTLTVTTNNQSVGLFWNGRTWRTYNAG